MTGQGEAGSLPRLSAGMLDGFIIEHVEPQLSPSWAMGEEARSRVRAAVKAVVLGADRVLVALLRTALATDCEYVGGEGMDATEVQACLPVHLKRSRGALIVDGESAARSTTRKLDRTLVRALVLARRWARQLESGEVGSIKELAQSNNLCPTYTMRLAPLAWLAPDITAMILEGRQPRGLCLADLIAQPLPLDWDAQRQFMVAIKMQPRG
jgi:site-specific DNA recombinase